MEFSSPVYELLDRCEALGMKQPHSWDLMSEPLLLDACNGFLKVKNGCDD